jgi:hypothetical protein
MINYYNTIKKIKMIKKIKIIKKFKMIPKNIYKLN